MSKTKKKKIKIKKLKPKPSWKDLVDTTHPSYNKDYESLTFMDYSVGGRAGYSSGGAVLKNKKVGCQIK